MKSHHEKSIMENSRHCINQFARIHSSSLINVEMTLNRPIAEFYNSDDVNMIAVELRLNEANKQCQQM